MVGSIHYLNKFLLLSVPLLCLFFLSLMIHNYFNYVFNNSEHFLFSLDLNLGLLPIFFLTIFSVNNLMISSGLYTPSIFFRDFTCINRHPRQYSKLHCMCQVRVDSSISSPLDWDPTLGQAFYFTDPTLEAQASLLSRAVSCQREP